MDGAGERVLDGHNTVSRFPSRYRIENILERSSREKFRHRRKQIDAGILAVGATGSLVGRIVALCHGGVMIPKLFPLHHQSVQGQFYARPSCGRMQSMAQPLAGVTVAIVEHRFTKEFTILFERLGAAVHACPMLEEKPVENRNELREFVRRTTG